MRIPMVAGNWKMNGSRRSVDELLEGIVRQLPKDSIATSADDTTGKVQVVVCPPAIFIPQTVAKLSEPTGDGDGYIGLIGIGAQNASDHESGAFTGEISPVFLADFGVQYVILGHSERRQLFHETDALVAAKFALAQQTGLTPIFCVGETQAQREAGATLQVVGEQLTAVIDQVGAAAFANAVVAYEPVWAIGTGLTATPDQAQEVHENIRRLFAERDQVIANQLRILYGGSVKGDNARSLFACPDIDGGLIGGASLKETEFVAICQAAVY